MSETASNGLTLYVSTFCFFCQKVLMFMRSNNIELEVRNTSDPAFRAQLVQGGGKTQVPCLLIQQDDGREKWMYESDDIIQYLSAARS